MELPARFLRMLPTSPVGRVSDKVFRWAFMLLLVSHNR